MLLAAIALAVGIASTASAATCSSDFDERTLVDNLRMPTGVAWTLDGGMLITEKSGQLEVVPKNSSVPQQIYDNGNRVNAYWGPRSARRRRRLGLRVQPTTSTCSTPSSSASPTTSMTAGRWSRGWAPRTRTATRSSPTSTTR